MKVEKNSNNTSACKYLKVVLVFFILIIALLFAMNGRYSYPVKGMVLDQWTGKVYGINEMLVEN